MLHIAYAGSLDTEVGLGIGIARLVPDAWMSGIAKWPDHPRGGGWDTYRRDIVSRRKTYE